ncbi:hypothetical protein EV182_006167, partial [Spiromyces aspiralis]
MMMSGSPFSLWSSLTSMRVEAQVLPATAEYSPVIDSDEFVDTRGHQSVPQYIVAGTVYVKHEKPIAATSLLVELCGDRSVSWVDRDSVGQAPYRSEKTFLTHQLYIFGGDSDTPSRPGSRAKLELPAGEQRFAFEIPITVTLPPTVTTDCGSITYNVRARLTVGGWLWSALTDVSSSTPVVLKHMPKHMLQWAPHYTKNMDVMVGTADTFYAKMTLPTRVWDIANDIPLTIVLDSPRVKRVQQVLLTAQIN